MYNHWYNFSRCCETGSSSGGTAARGTTRAGAAEVAEAGSEAAASPQCNGTTAGTAVTAHTAAAEAVTAVAGATTAGTEATSSRLSPAAKSTATVFLTFNLKLFHLVDAVQRTAIIQTYLTEKRLLFNT